MSDYVHLEPEFFLEVHVPENLLGHEDFEQELEAMLFDLGTEAMSFWETAAGQRLNTSREKYMEGMTFKHFGNRLYFELETAEAAALEFGQEPYSMREGFMKSDKMKMGKTGVQYLIIPGQRFDLRPFRTFHMNQPLTMWVHPGHEGAHILEDVQEEITENLFPRYFDELVDRLMGE